MAVADLVGAIDELFVSGGASCADGETLVELHRQLARLEAFVTEAVGAFDDSGEWAKDGARNATSWIAARCRLPRAKASRVVSRARHLAHLDVTADAFRTGDLAAAHVDALVRLDRSPIAEVLARDEELLVRQAKTLSFRDFTQVLAYWDQFADPDGTEERAEAQRTRRDVTMTQSFEGTWLGRITLDPCSGTIVADELDRLERQLFEADWKEAKEALGSEPSVADLPRTSAQRRADALVEMATRSKVASEVARRPHPLFTVLVDWPTLAGRVCELANGTVVAPGSLVPYLDGASLERAVFRPDGRVEVSERARFFSGATRRPVEVRDRICQHPLCDQPAEHCEVDHIRLASRGGPTTQANGRLLCGFHNKLRNRTEGRSPPEPDG